MPSRSSSTFDRSRAEPARLRALLTAVVAGALAAGIVPADAAAAPSDIVLSEIQYQPHGGDVREEFLELHNRAAEPLDISGWLLVEGVRFAFVHDIRDDAGHLIGDGRMYVFTTRADTIMGVTFCAVAPEHPLATHAAKSNAKLAARATRILVEVADCTVERAEHYLEAAGNNVKLAILMALTGLEAGAAQTALADADGFLRRAAAAHHPRAAS